MCGRGRTAGACLPKCSMECWLLVFFTVLLLAEQAGISQEGFQWTGSSDL